MAATRRRRRIGAAIAALVLLAGLVALLFRAPPGVPREAADDAPASGFDAAAAQAPTLAPAPADAGGSEGRKRAFEPGREAAGAEEIAGKPGLVVFFGSSVDDPALPKERLPLEVTLVDPKGAPVAGAAVQAVWGEWRTKTHVADETGHVTLDVPRGARGLEVVGIPLGDPRHFLLVHYHSLAGGESSTRVVVRTGSEISGRLLRADGSPVARAQVFAIPLAYGFGPVTTDEHGAFSMGVLEGSVVDVAFDGWRSGPDDGFAAESDAASLRALARSVAAGTKDLVLVASPLPSDATLRLRVFSSAGAPVAGVDVSASLPMRGRAVRGTTDAAGRLALADLPRWPVSVDVYAPASAAVSLGGVMQRFSRLPVDGGEVEVTFSAPARTALRGRVIDQRGQPVAGAWCAACVGHEYVACFPTDADGRFDSSVPLTAGGRFQLSARFPMERPTARGVLEDVTAGGIEPTIVLEEVGPLEAPSRLGGFTTARGSATLRR